MLTEVTVFSILCSKKALVPKTLGRGRKQGIFIEALLPRREESILAKSDSAALAPCTCRTEHYGVWGLRAVFREPTGRSQDNSAAGREEQSVPRVFPPEAAGLNSDDCPHFDREQEGREEDICAAEKPVEICGIQNT